MRILIDTNIAIHLEDSSQPLGESYGELIRLCLNNNHQLLIHPASFDDINRDRDERRRSISLSRLKKYNVLQNPPLPTAEDIKLLKLSENSENDKTDNQIIYSLYRDAYHLLITEDRNIHKKAKTLGLTDRVHYIDQTIEFLRRLYSKQIIYLPNIEEVPLYRININEMFFDSLRVDYPEFNSWFKRVCAEGRHAWIFRCDKGEIGAICIYKEEKNCIVTDDNLFLSGKVLKLCTFKVSERLQGLKIGELLLKAAFRYATNNDCDHIYITMNSEKQPFLEDLFQDFGFKCRGKHKRDDVYIKDQNPQKVLDVNYSALDFHINYFPHFKCNESIKKFIVPIRPTYHKLIFPDIQTQGSLLIHTTGNAIKQAYLCHAPVRNISPGDILLFYRSHDLKAVTSIGIVEQIRIFDSADEIMQMVSKRTVYSYRDIVKMAQKKTMVILFRLATHLKDPIPYVWMQERKVINGKIQTITSIKNESFKKIKAKWRLDCLYAN